MWFCTKTMSSPSPTKKEADLLLFPHSQELSTAKDTFSVDAVAYITDGRNWLANLAGSQQPVGGTGGTSSSVGGEKNMTSPQFSNLMKKHCMFQGRKPGQPGSGGTTPTQGGHRWKILRRRSFCYSLLTPQSYPCEAWRFVLCSIFASFFFAFQI